MADLRIFDNQIASLRRFCQKFPISGGDNVFKHLCINCQASLTCLFFVCHWYRVLRCLLTWSPSSSWEDTWRWAPGRSRGTEPRHTSDTPATIICKLFYNTLHCSFIKIRSFPARAQMQGRRCSCLILDNDPITEGLLQLIVNYCSVTTSIRQSDKDSIAPDRRSKTKIASCAPAYLADRETQT